MDILLSVIKDVGFPIACVGALMWYTWDTRNKNREDIAQLNASHERAEEKMTEALENNTVAVVKLCERLQKDEGGD